MLSTEQQLVNLIHAWARDKFEQPRPFDGRCPVTSKLLDANDFAAMGMAVLEGHLTHGKHSEEFERDLASQFGLKHAAFCCSGSSANLLALAALMQPEMGDARLKPGDEVVVCAAGFPTTVNPVAQLGLVPVFVDCELGTYNADPAQVVAALQRPKARARMLAHTLGNPIDWAEISDKAKRRYWVVEDCCDALGSTVRGEHVGRHSDVATCSFYPAHHITTGEGGAVLTDSAVLAKVVESLRDWGRDCWCRTGKDNTCGKRFEWLWKAVGANANHPTSVCELPNGYDHKHVFSRLGWNFKATDIQAALGVSQLRKLPMFEARRRRNFTQLYAGLWQLADQNKIILPKPTPNSSPSWFGFPITVKPPLDRTAVVRHLEAAGVSTRPIFAGNLLRQPAYRGVESVVFGDLANADRVMRDSFYVGVHPGLGEEHVAYMVRVIGEACE